MKCETAFLQNKTEITGFANLLAKEKVRSYLEIGSKFGGSLWIVANALPKGSRIVSVDLPHGDTSFKESEPPLRECIAALKNLGYDAHLFLGDSTDPAIIEKVKALAPFDACFIDANHTEPYVRKDWETYGQLSNIVAFHDIGHIKRPEPSKKMPIDVPKVWAELKPKFRNVEFRLDARDNGIGVLWVR